MGTKTALAIVGGVALLVWNTALALARDAVTSWVNSFVAEIFGISGLPAKQAISFFVAIAPALAVAAFCFAVGALWMRHRHLPASKPAPVAAPPIELAPARVTKGIGPIVPALGDFAIRHAMEGVALRLNRDKLTVLGDFRQAARDGALDVWGRPNGSEVKPREKIPPEHWRDFGLNAIQCLYQERPIRCRTTPDEMNNRRHDECYADLRVNRQQVETLWPAPAVDHAPDPEIDRIRRDVHALADRLCNSDVYEDQQKDLVERYARIEASDHMMWSTEPLKQLRRDFLNRCGWAMRNGKWYGSAEERNDSQAEILRFAAEIDAAIAGR